MRSQLQATPSLGIHPISQLLHGGHYFPEGETLSIPFGQYHLSPRDSEIVGMYPVEETRRSRLRMLVEKHGSMANLCERLGYARNETVTLTRVINANVRHERGGKTYNMGSPMAREIEEKLGLELGWMDTPPSYNEIHGREDPKAKAMLLLEQMSPDQAQVATRLLTAIAEPEKKQGNGG